MADEKPREWEGAARAIFGVLLVLAWAVEVLR